MAIPDSTKPPADEASGTPVVASIALTNATRLRTHLKPGGLAVALMAVWKKGDPDAPARMLNALHTFHELKTAGNGKIAD